MGVALARWLHCHGWRLLCSCLASHAIWPHLKSGGTLVYATCSVLPEENSQQIAAFLKRTSDAALRDTGTPESPGLQNLPGAEEGDGFFYAKLIKE